VDSKSIKTDVDRIVNKAAAARRKEESTKAKQDAIGYSDRVNTDYAKAPAVAKNEENLLGLLLLYPEHRKTVFEGELLTRDDFFTDLNGRIFDYLKNAYFTSGDSHHDMDECFTPDEIGRTVKMKISRMELTENGGAVLLDCISALKKSVRKKNSENNSSLDSLAKLVESKRKS
jgi:hypothetical protein